MVAVVDHEPGLSAVDADVFAGDEARLVGCQEQNHMGNVQGIAHPSGGLLGGIRAFIDPIVRINPAGTDGVDPHPSGEAHRQRMGQRRNAALGGGVTLRLGLAHSVPGRGDVDDAGPRRKMGCKELAQVKGRRHALGQGPLKLGIAALVDADEAGRRIVHQHIHPAVSLDDAFRKSFQIRLFAHIAHKMIAFGAVDDAHLCALLPELVGDAFADAPGAAGDDDDFILKHPHYFLSKYAWISAIRSSAVRRPIS